MKQKIKALAGKTTRLLWHKNGWHYNAVGVIGDVKIVQFVFTVNGNLKINIRFENVTDIQPIKEKDGNKKRL